MAYQPGEIEGIQFGIAGTEDIRTRSHVSITVKDLFRNGLPIERGVYAPQMGTTDYSWDCKSCINKKDFCDGHAGSIETKYSIKNPLFRDYSIKWLRVICFSCGKLVSNYIPTGPKKKWLSDFIKHAPIEKIDKKPVCVHCKAVIYKPVRSKIESNKFSLEKVVNGVTIQEELFNHEIKQILNRISDEDVLKLGKPLCSSPDRLIWDAIPILPNTGRPDIKSVVGNRSNNSDTTACTKSLTEQNNLLPEIIPDRKTLLSGKSTIRDAYYAIDATAYTMIRGTSKTSNNSVKLKTSGNKQIESIASNLPGKRKRVRQNLLGKRTVYGARTVITGDNSIKLDQLGVPESIAKNLSIPEKVTEKNFEEMNMYFRNRENYPGCTGLIRKNKSKYNTSQMADDAVLEIGDTLLRHLKDGDPVVFNRPPSLTFSSTGTHSAKIVKGQTFRMNVSSCIWYNADFDGDCMMIAVPQSIISRNEISILNHVSEFMMSYKHSGPLPGNFQDSLIGMAELTQSEIRMDKWHAMSMFSDTEDLDPKHGYELKFTKQRYTGREIVSMALPAINLVGGKAKFYDEKFVGVLPYKKEDIVVNIKRGEILSGVLDKSTVGQEVAGSIYQIICEEFSARKALATIYDYHQITAKFFLNRGFTLGIKDILYSDEAKREVQDCIDKMLYMAEEITKKLDSGELTPPVGVKLEDYYESEIMQALNTEDDGIKAIMKEMDIKTNGILKLIMYGSKGKKTNFSGINECIGQTTVGDKRIKFKLADNRTSPYFPRYDSSPESRGFILTSYANGIPADGFAFAAAEAKGGLINNALSTATTGNQNRLSVKCLESNIINNQRGTCKKYALTQPLYAETGIDPRKTSMVKFPTLMSSDSEFEKQYNFGLDCLHKSYRNKPVKAVLDEWYKVVKTDRTELRNIWFTIMKNSPKRLIGDEVQMPVNIHNVISNVVYNHKDEVKDEQLDPILTIKKIKALCKSINYCYYNQNWEDSEYEIAEHYDAATTFFRILIRSALSLKTMLEMGVTDSLLEFIIEIIKIKFKNSLIDYGTTAGILAAQCVIEPLTQHVLNSKHRVGVAGGSETDVIVRAEEIMCAKNTEKMKNPSILAVPKEEFIKNKLKVQEIANHIEMMSFDRFISKTQIFYEEYGKPVHSEYANEVNMIKEFEKYSVIQRPNDLTSWCMRFELDHDEMLTNTMKLSTIIDQLNKQYPNMHVVHTPENVDNLVIRCYFRYNMLKITGTQNIVDIILDLKDKIKSIVIRGIDHIKSAKVVKVNRSYIDKDNSIQHETVFMIRTSGTNYAEVLENPFLNPQQTQTDSIIEYSEHAGIGATTSKIIYEFDKTLDGVNPVHTSMYADEMTYTGEVTNITRSGMNKRDVDNTLLRTSFQFPVQNLEESAINGTSHKINGISPVLMMGGSIYAGTGYNRVIVNENFIKSAAADLSAGIADLL
jgi:DNA-directed RNA polymerase beta' subunit